MPVAVLIGCVVVYLLLKLIAKKIKNKTAQKIVDTTADVAGAAALTVATGGASAAATASGAAVSAGGKVAAKAIAKEAVKQGGKAVAKKVAAEAVQGKAVEIINNKIDGSSLDEKNKQLAKVATSVAAEKVSNKAISKIDSLGVSNACAAGSDLANDVTNQLNKEMNSFSKDKQ